VPVVTLMADWGLKHQHRKSRLSDAVAHQTGQPQNDSRVEKPA
jgi:hypothetical protein